MYKQATSTCTFRKGVYADGISPCAVMPSSRKPDPNAEHPGSLLDVSQHHLDPAIRASTFRLEPQKASKGTVYYLTSGSRKERQAMSLGYCSAEEARIYLAGIESVRMFWLLWQTMALRDLGVMLEESPDAEPRLTMPEWPVDGSGPLVWDPVSPGRILALARKPARHDAVLRYLRSFGEKGVNLTTNPVKFQQRVAEEAEPIPPMVAAMMPLREYHDRVWASQRKAAFPKTWKNEAGLWRLHLLPALGDKKLGDLNTASFNAFFSRVRQLDGKEFSYHALKRIRIAYQALMSEAELAGIPVQAHKYRRLRGLGVSSKPFDVLTPADLKKLCDNTDTVHAAMFSYAFYTGSRPAEVARVRWSAFDWAPSKKAPCGRVWIDGRKTEKSNDVLPIHEDLRARLQALCPDGKPPTGDSPVFLHRGVALVDPKKALKSAARKAGLGEGRRVFPYLFRHSYATWLLENGVPFAEVALLMRHTSEAMLRRIYDHAKVADKVDIRRLLVKKPALKARRRFVMVSRLASAPAPTPPPLTPGGLQNVP